MARLAFESNFTRSSGFFEYPKLKLEAGEKARICIIDSAPEAKYVHTLRKLILINGRPVMEQQKYGKNFEKTRDVPKTDFVGKFICLGNEDVVDKNEIDPDNCPACKAAADSAGAVEKPQRRIVFHVIRYKTNKGAFTLQKPFQVDLLAWDVTDNRFRELVEIREEHGNLAEVDLNLGPCENATFQKYSIVPGSKAEWAVDDSRKQIIKEVWSSQKSDKLTELLGNTVTPSDLASRVAEVVNIYNLGFGNNDVNSMPTTNSDSDFSNLLDGDETKLGEDADFFNSGSTEKATEEPTNEELGEEKKEEPKKGGVEDLDSLLADFS